MPPIGANPEERTMPIDPDLTAEVHQLMPYAALIGLEVERFDAAEVRCRVAWAPERCTSGGILHGGLLMGIADSVGAMVAVRNLPADATGTTTVGSSTSFLRGVPSGAVHAVSRPVHAGRTTIVAETELRDDAGRLVAKVTQTQLVLR